MPAGRGRVTSRTSPLAAWRNRIVGSGDESPAALVLASLDPLAAMATADAAKLEALLADITPSDDALARIRSRAGATKRRSGAGR